ncbi:MAG: hypothetical protein ACFCU6_00810, partial [Balneolaceae bacterium]
MIGNESADRRKFTSVRLFAILLFAALMLPGMVYPEQAVPVQQPPPPKLHDLGDGVYVFEYLYSNSPFVVTDDGVLVMDTYNEFYARALKQQIS